LLETNFLYTAFLTHNLMGHIANTVIHHHVHHNYDVAPYKYTFSRHCLPWGTHMMINYIFHLLDQGPANHEDHRSPNLKQPKPQKTQIICKAQDTCNPKVPYAVQICEVRWPIATLAHARLVQWGIEVRIPVPRFGSACHMRRLGEPRDSHVRPKSSTIVTGRVRQARVDQP
jgi:hypothetical protein